MVQNPFARNLGGRPRKQDPQVALAAAADRFWATGFAGTSLDELSEATGMKRPSIYATFGDKRALYFAALRDRIRRNAEALREALSADLPLAAVLECTFLGAIRLNMEEGGRGCFLLSTALTPALHDSEIAGALREGLETVEEAFAERFRAEPGVEDPSTLAGLAAATIHQIAVSVRSGVDPARVTRQARSAARLLGAPASV